MAFTALGASLTATQRLQQIRLRATIADDLAKVWPAFDPYAISKSWAKLEPILVALVQSRQPVSVRIAARYLAEFRRAERVAGSVTASIPDIPHVADIIPNLRFIGPTNAFALVDRGASAGDIARLTFSNVEGELTRQILNGGRGCIVSTVQRDDHAEGWARVTDGTPCSFCALLATRGGVYKSEGSGGFSAHRKCACTAEPIYDRSAPLPAIPQQWYGLYRQAYGNVRGYQPGGRSAAVRREFRRLYDAQGAPGPSRTP